MKDYQQVFQGDVWLMKLPDTMKIEKEAVIPNHMGKLILQEGEMTGHHHYVDTIDRAPAYVPEGEDIASAFTDPKLKEMFGKKKAEVSATLYNAAKVAEKLVKEDILLRADLVVGLLDIKGGPMNVYHQEHGSLCLGPGKYVVGRQIESVAGEERRVAD